MEGASWVRRRNDNKLCINQIIRIILKNELQPKDEDCEEFLSALWKKFEFQYPVNTALFKQAAALYENAANDLPDAHGNFSYCAGHSYLVIERFGRAKDYAHKSKKIRENILSMWNIELAKSYNDVGAILMYFARCSGLYLGEFEKAFKCRRSAFKHFLSAYAIFMKSAPDNPHFGETLLHLAKFFENDKAVTAAEVTVNFFKNQPPQFRFKLAAAYSALGRIFKNAKKFAEALAQMKLAAETYKSIAPADGNQDLALSYVNISDTYWLIGDITNAIEYLERAVQIQEKIFAEGHFDTFNSYKKAVELYKSAGRLDKAELYLKKISDSFKPRRKFYGKKMLELNFIILDGNIELDDEMLAHRYCSTADAYRDIGDYDNAEKYILMSKEKISDNVSANVVWLTYFTASQIYQEKKAFEKAIHYVRKALAMTETEELQSMKDTCLFQLQSLQNDMKNNVHREKSNNFLSQKIL